MVVIISDNEDLKNYDEKLDNIVQTIINMEDNINNYNSYKIYDKINNDVIDIELHSKQFLIIVYSDILDEFAIISSLINKLQIIENKNTVKCYHCDENEYRKFTHHIEISRQIKKNRIIKEYKNNENYMNHNNINWEVMVINKENNASFLVLSKISNVEFFNYLSLSPFTIIWDKIGLLNYYENIHKQLNFPYVNQYRYNNLIENEIFLFEKNVNSLMPKNIVDLHIFIKLLMQENIYMFDFDRTRIILHKDLNCVLKFNDIHSQSYNTLVNVINTNDTLENNCINLLKADEEKFDESKIYRCFVTNTVLFNIVHILKIKYKYYSKEFIKYILCSNIAFEGKYGNKGSGEMTIYKALESIFNLLKIEASITKHGVVYIDNIHNVINNLQIEINEKNLLISMVNNGLKKNNIDNSINEYYSNDYNSGMLYVGSKTINDSHIIKYRENINVILFGIKWIK